MEEYLYHYTSIEKLVLILKNKNICFNNLTNVDDLEEPETEDMGSLGKFCYVSCWTNDSKESIPLWNMYTEKMQGVRIKLPRFPFVEYLYKKGEFYFTSDTKSYIDYRSLIEENKACIVPGFPKLIEVEYTDDESLLYLKVKTEMSDISVNKKTISIKNIGKYKRTNWAFQKEMRYKIFILPISMADLFRLKDEEPDKIQLKTENFLNSLNNKVEAPYTRYFLALKQDLINNIEILLGPKVTEVQEMIIKLIIEKYCPNAIVKKSKLLIR